MIKFIIIIFTSILFRSVSSYGNPIAGKETTSPLYGGTAAVRNSAAAAQGNPANAAFLKTSEIDFEMTPYAEDSMRIRYPTLPTVNQKKNGFVMPSAPPTYIYKPSPNWGINLLALPPMKVPFTIDKKEVPIIVLNTINNIDISAQPYIKAYASGIISYKFNRRFGLGLSFNYMALTADASLKQGGSEITTAQLDQTTSSSRIGARFAAIPGRITIGAAARIFTLNKTNLELDSSALNSATNTEDSEDEETDENGGIALVDNFLLGVLVSLGNLDINVDVAYQRPSTGKSMSLVKLKKVQKETYATLAIRAGSKLELARRVSLLAAYQREPTGIGPGGASDGDLAGFGSYEILEMYMFGGSLKPFTEMGLGMEVHMGSVINKTKRKRQRKVGKQRKKSISQFSPVYRSTLRFGLVYRKASLGIDEDGELPGAYSQTKTYIPLGISVRL